MKLVILAIILTAVVILVFTGGIILGIFPSPPINPTPPPPFPEEVLDASKQYLINKVGKDFYDQNIRYYDAVSAGINTKPHQTNDSLNQYSEYWVPFSYLPLKDLPVDREYFTVHVYSKNSSPYEANYSELDCLPGCAPVLNAVQIMDILKQQGLDRSDTRLSMVYPSLTQKDWLVIVGDNNSSDEFGCKIIYYSSININTGKFHKDTEGKKVCAQP